MQEGSGGNDMTAREKVLRTNPQAVCIHSDEYEGRAPGWKVYDRGVTGLVWNAMSMSFRNEEDAWANAWLGILGRNPHAREAIA